MTLGEFAYLLDADPKWVQNVAAGIGGTLRYTDADARRLGIVRALGGQLGVPIPRAYEMAVDVLKRYDGSRRPVALTDADGFVVATVDVYRVLAALNTGRARLHTMYAPRRRGRRKSDQDDPIRRAAEHGLDLTLLAANLRRTPSERLRQLDTMADFRHRVRRA